MPNVAWGDMHHFMTYAGKLNPWFPAAVIPTLAWFVTAVESTARHRTAPWLQNSGCRTRLAAKLAGWMLLAFAIGTTAGTGIKSSLNRAPAETENEGRNPAGDLTCFLRG